MAEGNLHRNYADWRKLKQRLKEEGNETVTNCHDLKMTAADGKKRMTDVATTEKYSIGDEATIKLSKKSGFGEKIGWVSPEDEKRDGGKKKKQALGGIRGTKQNGR